ncbi:hypothetical protein [Stenotrophomonas nitritireducens]|uniref:hypothetical protein n=1 Tax=Stenotrophomonas nitritireducens TaxID=83617 RepID=UPI003D95A935
MPTLPDAVRQFIEAATVVGDMALPFHYPTTEEWERWQSGFRVHGITGESLVAATPGEWQPGWHVVALNGFDDPFFIDLGEAAQNFPVYYAPNGAGRWDAEQAAPSLRHLGEMLAALQRMGDDDAAALRWIEAEVGLTSALWREVFQTRQQRHVEPPTPTVLPASPADWQRGTLVITAIGPQKMKIVQHLKRVQDLSPQEALALAEQGDIAVAEGCLAQLRDMQVRLQALGATVEFRPDEPSTPRDEMTPSR